MRISFPRYVLLILFAVSTTACNVPEPKVILEPSNIQPVDSNSAFEEFKAVDNDGIVFEYVLSGKDRDLESQIFDLECLIINKTDHEVFYLHQSCPGLMDYLLIKPDSYKILPHLCFASSLVISCLAPSDSLKFKAPVIHSNNSDLVEKIGLDLRTVDCFVPKDTLWKYREIVQSIYPAQTESDHVIWGNSK
ncbi:hypothetical protein [Pontibacter sp. G13]|uniref:hypothetical protein n=1 Tax=Pontibacter sp. G13 TaxID=3074898 RepID=UPI00288BCA46|nr:hypothetical protein [Pontibacter sp. G13]WNJ19623.1 hypothetical protein RJD25_03980 [Pontibacter sp. G13]